MKLSKFYKNKKVFVTGATGFKGSWLCFLLNKFGANVVGTGLRENSQKLFYQLNLKNKIKIYHNDIRDYKSLNKIVNNFKPEIIFHLAAQPIVRESYEKPLNTFDINFMGTVNILDISFNLKFVKSLVCVTTDKVYFNKNWLWGYRENDALGGDDPYSASKAAAEIAISSYKKSFNKPNLGVASARAGNVIGGGDMSRFRLIPDCIRSLIKNKKIIIRNPNSNRPWQHVLEPVHGYLILGQKLFFNPRLYSQSYNFGPSTESIMNVKEIVKSIIKIWGGGKFEIINDKIKEHKILQLNIDKTRKVLKWKPVLNLEETIRETVFWYKSVVYEKKDAVKITSEQISNFFNKI